MEKYIFEGKTSTEAIEKGLKELKLRKDEVEINILKDEKRSFFSILEPRIVKVEITKKEKKEKKEHKEEKTKKEMSTNAIEKAKKTISEFLDAFLSQISSEKLEYRVINDKYYIIVEISGENTNNLIGYRGETLNAIQNILCSIANKEIEEKVRVILDISGYKEKRKKILEELADKKSKIVMKTGKKVILEPMPAYERKIIHSRLQNNKNVTTESVGDEPYRKIIIELKRK